jgi:hypothetical protein
VGYEHSKSVSTSYSDLPYDRCVIDGIEVGASSTRIKEATNVRLNNTYKTYYKASFSNGILTLSTSVVVGSESTTAMMIPATVAPEYTTEATFSMNYAFLDIPIDKSAGGGSYSSTGEATALYINENDSVVPHA